MISSQLFCTHCGAANLAQATFCYACGQAIQTPGNAQAAPGSGPLQVGALLKQRCEIPGSGGQWQNYRDPRRERAKTQQNLAMPLVSEM